MRCFISLALVKSHEAPLRLSIRTATTDKSVFAAILDKPRVEPPDNIWPAVVNLRTMDWSLWRSNANAGAYGFSAALFLGLARPDLALLNAENYAMFALCMTLTNLQCTTVHSVTNTKRENSQNQVAPEGVNNSRESGSVWPPGFGKESESMAPLRVTKENFGEEYL